MSKDRTTIGTINSQQYQKNEQDSSHPLPPQPPSCTVVASVVVHRNIKHKDTNPSSSLPIPCEEADLTSPRKAGLDNRRADADESTRSCTGGGNRCSRPFLLLHHHARPCSAPFSSSVDTNTRTRSTPPLPLRPVLLPRWPPGSVLRRVDRVPADGTCVRGRDEGGEPGFTSTMCAATGWSCVSTRHPGKPWGA